LTLTRVRRGVAFLLPALLLLTGLAAKEVAGRAMREFVGYSTPFAFEPVSARMGPPVSRQVLVVLVDGLAVQASRTMPFLNELRARGADYECRVGEPSLSLPGRAVMLSGAWAEINGQTTNYNPRPLRVEHAFTVARRQGVFTALAGAPSGLQLFASALAGAVAYAKDPETAPASVYEAAQARQAQQAGQLLDQLRGGRALSMVELHAVDETGHGWGAASPEYAHAAAEADTSIRDLASRLDLMYDTLIVTADHGHIAAGGHGGSEEAVLQVPLVLAGAGVRAGSRGSCRQIDLAPTLSALLGLTVPSSNQGRPLLDALTLEPAHRLRALRALLAQREAYVPAYIYRLASIGDETAPDYSTSSAVEASVPADASEAWMAARLDALDRREADARKARRMLETQARARPTLIVVFSPLVLAALLVALGVIGGGELRRAALAAALSLALYHLALPALGLRYSITAINKDEWVAGFFRKDMVAGVAACVIAVLLGAWRERRFHGADRFDLARFSWAVTAAFCYAFVVKVALVYWEQDVATRWEIADMRWAFGFYLDILVVMAAGLLSPLMVLPAWLGGRLARSSASPAPS
jgi:hypothetical protein